jgi:hypothetical protein
VSDRYDTFILVTALIILMGVIAYGNRDIWATGKRAPSGVRGGRISYDWIFTLASVAIVLGACLFALDH